MPKARQYIEFIFVTNLTYQWKDHLFGIAFPWYLYSHNTSLKVYWRLSTVLKTRKKVYELINVFWYVKECIFWKCIQYTIHWDKPQMLKKVPQDKINVTKNAIFILHEFQLIKVLLLICDSYMSWSTRSVSLKPCVEFPIFDSVLFLSKFIFLFNEMNGLFDFKTS